MKTAIEFNNISKQYRLGLVSSGTISHDLNRWWTTRIRGKEDPYLKIGETNDRSTKGTSDYIWALKDIDFKIEQGDVMGIIGRNGAGKSTLLKILSRVTTPTTGQIRAAGRIASLLEVGTGFHPEMTGRENIYMNGSIMGMTKHEISSKLDEIVDFSGCERYLDTPAKRYSSGMTVRLGFAIAAHLDPEILVVDEVLAVGDAEFQQKAIGKMQDVAKGDGRTVLFVSHNMTSIRQLCNNGILLKNGQIDFTGKIDDVVDKYLSSSIIDANSPIKSNIQRISNLIQIDNILVNGKDNSIQNINTLKDNTITIEIYGYAKEQLTLSLECALTNHNEVKLGCFTPAYNNSEIIKYSPGKFLIKENLIIPNNINKGDLFLNLFLAHPNIEYYLEARKCCKLTNYGQPNSMGLEFTIQNQGFLNLERSK